MAPEDKPLSPIMTVQEVADFLHVHSQTIYKLLRKGELPAFRVGSDWRFARENVDRWCREQVEKQQLEAEKRNPD